MPNDTTYNTTANTPEGKEQYLTDARGFIACQISDLKDPKHPGFR